MGVITSSVVLFSWIVRSIFKVGFNTAKPRIRKNNSMEIFLLPVDVNQIFVTFLKYHKLVSSTPYHKLESNP